MSKLTNYIFLMTGILLLMHFTGLVEGTPNSALFNLVMNPENIPNSGLYNTILAIVGVVMALSVITLGFVQKTDFILIATMITILFSFGWDFLVVFQKLNSINHVLALLIFSPLMIVYVITVVEWWRGVDTG